MNTQKDLQAGVNDTRNLNFYQIQCDKHEFVMVTQESTVTKNGKTEVTSRSYWFQCRHCGKTNERRKK